jgi:hypothetical protein
MCSRCGVFEAKPIDLETSLKDAREWIKPVFKEGEYIEFEKEVINFIKTKEPLCTHCMSYILCNAMLLRTRNYEDPEKFLKALEYYQETIEWNTLSRHIKTIFDVMDEVHLKNTYKILWRLIIKLKQPNQPYQVSEHEKEYIKIAEKSGISLRDIAFILDRSTETIHRHMKKL